MKEAKRFAKCEYCGEVWNVGKYQKLPKEGYMCPHCREKERRGKIPQRKKNDSKRR